MFYQWGHKDPYTFATNSELWGSKTNEQYGKYPVKIYTVDGVLIYQESNGSNNKDKQPVGGIIHSSTLATSMMQTIKNPIMFSGGNGSVVNQVGHTKSLWDYYWTSHSRGVDGNRANAKWHNSYLDGHASQQLKSIFDPCPFGFTIPPSGSYIQFERQSPWTVWSYTGGRSWIMNNTKSWFPGLGRLQFVTNGFLWTGNYGYYYSSIPYSNTIGYAFSFNSTGWFSTSYDTDARGVGFSVRCIDFFVSPPRPTEETHLVLIQR